MTENYLRVSVKRIKYEYKERRGSQMQGFITPNEAAKKWNITTRQVQILCKSERIPGAIQISRIWLIPESAEKPTKTRTQGLRKREENNGEKED